MGFFAGLNPEKYDRQYSDRDLIKRIFDYLRSERRRLSIVIIITIILSAVGAMQPLIVSEGVDLIAVGSDAVDLVLIPGAILLVGLTTWGLNWIRRAITVRALANIIMNMRTKAFEAAAAHDLSFYDQFSSGRIVSRITSDTNDFSQLVNIITEVGAQILQALILGIILVNTEWRLSLYLFSFLPIIFLLAYGFRRLARIATRNGMRAMADVNAAIKETVSGISIAKNFRQENAIFEDFNTANQTSYQVNVRRGFVLSLVFPVLNATIGIFVAVLVYAGGMNAAQAVITAGSWYLFILSLDRFLWPVMNLSAFWSQIQSGLSAAERVFALIDAEPAVNQIDDRPVEILKGEIVFKDFSFQYTDNEPVLADFNLSIHPGENLAIVGHTGAGKSSIAKLIARFYEYQDGSLLIDGKDIRTFNLQTFRRQLGMVSQIPFLFSGTVAENIRYALSEGVIEDSDIMTIARSIGDGEWLETLPEGLETEVGERGARLSMGQRQLVALMRVLVQRPSIFILDEATASIDPFTEWQIQQALKMILAESTSILIAHRLSTVKAADRIIVLDHGTIIEEGNHDHLLVQNGHYAELYNTYFRHQSLAYVEQVKEFVSRS